MLLISAPDHGHSSVSRKRPSRVSSRSKLSNPTHRRKRRPAPVLKLIAIVQTTGTTRKKSRTASAGATNGIVPQPPFSDGSRRPGGLPTTDPGAAVLLIQAKRTRLAGG